MSKKKEAKNEDRYLSGKLLIAMPSMTDPRFHRAVIFICAHDAEGAMGLTINKPMPGIQFKDLLKQLDIQSEATGKNMIDISVMQGGPVENARGFILHDKNFKEPDTVEVGADYGVTGTIDAIKKIAGGHGPQNMIFALGYAGWSAGQLDQELQANAWLALDADPEIVFHERTEDKWDLCVRKIGVDPAMLSAAGGRA